ncbi:hypothetical protein BS47DRAFT_1368184 [Hydnum rufescens UP504]|uniref:Uncharacterized protein n=1 Tax=Hydnum rufescens UP504 TaxID=1448309 RepID=A0A9P6DNK5_9AGAM|nr:hypothetical protein BS47DRAFT_1368184 [Hydnum rufescens UP504]
MPTNFSGPVLPSPTTPEAEGEWSTTWSHSEPVLLSSTTPEAAEDSEAAGARTSANPELAELQEEDYYIKYRKFARHLEILDLQESYIKDEQANLKRELIRVTLVMENNNHLVGIEKKALYEELQEEDYIKYKKLAHHLEMVDLQESYIKNEQANLKCEPIQAQEVKCIQSVPLVISQFLRPIDHLTGIVGINNWLELYPNSNATCLLQSHMEGTNRLYIGLLIPGVHPNHCLEHWPTRDVKNVFTYLAAWCMIQGIVIERPGFRTTYSSNFVIQVAVEGLQAAEDTLEFFHCGWPSWLSEAMVVSARTDEVRWEVLSAHLDLATPYDRFCPHPPPPLKLACTPDITVGWYLPLSTWSTAVASSANFPTVPNVATDSGPLTGNKRKPANSGASMPPAKWFKGADLDPMETDPEIVGDEMEGMEHTPGNDVMMMDDQLEHG